jgi:NAD(P)-dependent dehydrogenase (short-subunit alcohol dehydrogenase family)
MSLLTALKRPGPNGFGMGTTAEQVTAGLDLQDRTILLTGCNSGIGFETLRVLGLRGAHVLGLARTEAKAREAMTRASTTGTPLACDLAEPASVRACVEAVQALGRPLDAVVCNAGIMALPRLHQRHGLELQFLTNHVGHFLLVTGLFDTIAEGGRVVVVSSAAHRRAPAAGIEFDNLSGTRGYNPWRAYGHSKLANILFTRALAKRLPGGRTANALHPGVIHTNLLRYMGRGVDIGAALVEPLVFKSAAQGAATQCYLAAHPDVAGVTGQYFADCNPEPPSPLAEDAALAERLWVVSEEIAAHLA